MTPDPREERRARLSLMRRLGHVERKVQNLPAPPETQNEDERRFDVVERRMVVLEQRVTTLERALVVWRSS